ncbi:20398_t:CDS:2, partial [Dentiscutata erythropus]
TMFADRNKSLLKPKKKLIDGKEIEMHIFEIFVLTYYEKNILPNYSYKEPFTRKEFIDEISFWNIDIETFNIEICVLIMANKIKPLFDLLQKDIEKNLTLFINDFSYCLWIDGVIDWIEYDEYYGDKICKKIENFLKILDYEVKLSRENRERYNVSPDYIPKIKWFVLSIKINKDILKSEVMKKLESDYF